MRGTIQPRHQLIGQREPLARGMMTEDAGTDLWDRLTRTAQHSLARTQPEMSARETLWGRQAVAIGATASGTLLWGLVHPISMILILNVLLACLFLSVGLARVVVVCMPMPALITRHIDPSRAADENLPAYSVLVPIYDEAAMVPQLVRSLAALDYPHDKLQVLILAEADDEATLRALEATDLPAFIEVVRVPPSHPRTKPKALNVGLALAHGRYVTIYDAEDRPERDQLRLAATAFDEAEKGASKPLACVQAALNITNTNAGFLTRHFALEYMALFDAFLPALSRFDLPIPLGGTSNHFRRDVLLRVGGWDPFNVTEDADLGIRLARLGYSTRMIDSTTFEEAPTRFAPWIRQRSRWFKGWWQTWLVHMRQPGRLLSELGLPGFTAFQTIMLGVLVSVLIHPLFLIAALWTIGGVGDPLFADINAANKVLLTLNIANFVLGYLAAAALSGVGAERRGIKGVAPVLLTIPLYWLCLSAAGVLALWELVRRPHHWHKTPHRPPIGVSI